MARWFPQLPDAHEITIRELGSMSSGIASYTTNPAITDRYFNHPTMRWAPDRLIAGGASLPRLFTPGRGFNYSDTNFVILGRIIELLTHQPLARVMRAMLFKPLMMNASSYPTSNRLPGPSCAATPSKDPRPATCWTRRTGARASRRAPDKRSRRSRTYIGGPSPWEPADCSHRRPNARV
jgi:CubicO group peptidase (beta-lactamase class C family)